MSCVPSRWHLKAKFLVLSRSCTWRGRGPSRQHWWAGSGECRELHARVCACMRAYACMRVCMHAYLCVPGNGEWRELAAASGGQRRVASGERRAASARAASGEDWRAEMPGESVRARVGRRRVDVASSLTWWTATRPSIEPRQKPCWSGKAAMHRLWYLSGEGI